MAKSIPLTIAIADHPHVALRLAWGSNFPASEGTLADHLALARTCLTCLSEEDQAWIFAKAARRLYPVLAA